MIPVSRLGRYCSLYKDRDVLPAQQQSRYSELSPRWSVLAAPERGKAPRD